MKTPRTIVALALVTVLAAGAAFATDLEDEPGYVDLEWITIPDDADEIQDIDLTPMLLAAAKDVEDEDTDAALMEALTMVRSIRVRAWSMDDEDARTSDAVERITTRLKKESWKRLIYVKSDDETVVVNAKYDDGDMVGLVLVVHEPGDSVAFVNVVGDLDLANLFKLATMIDSEELDDLMVNHDH
ncbi:MAG: DUF4252 domain-containing protein [bacterium]|nr:DUF4252 domain-containing protein [bacterium]